MAEAAAQTTGAPTQAVTADPAQVAAANVTGKTAGGQATRGPDGKFLPQGAAQTPAATGAAPGAVAEAAKEAMRKHRVKVDGQDMEVDEEELKRGYSHQRAANKILQEGKSLRKQNEEFLTKMRDKATVIDVLKKLGHDPRKLSEEYLASQLEDELMDPRDKELRDTKARLKQIEDMEKKQQEAVQKQRHEEMKVKYAKEYETQFVEALKKSQLPPTKPMVAEMAKYIARSAKIGFKMTPEEAAQLVREDIQVAHQRLIGDSDGEILLKLLGDNVANKIRKYDTDKLKTPEQVLRTPVEQGAPRTREPKRRLTAHEWRLHKLGKA